MAKSEHQIQNEIRVAISAADCTIFRTNTGTVIMPDGRPFSTGLPKGFPDLCGFRHRDGKAFFIEVKNERGQLRPEQTRFAKFAQRYPILYGVARSAEDALKIINGD